MFSQPGQRNVSSNALSCWVFIYIFFSLALAAKGSASQFVNSAESVGCISAVL